MGSVQTILLELVTYMVNIVSDPIFIVMAILIIYMYKREAKNTGDKGYILQVECTAVKDIFRGSVIGAIMSLILTSLDISITITPGMLILIPITIVLVLINPKWGCFSYVIPINYAIQAVGRVLGQDMSWFNLSYKELIILIGILHIVEGILVGTYGYENGRPTPFYQDHKLVSAYTLKKFWPMPLMVFRYSSGIGGFIPMYALLGYADIAVRENPKKKTKTTGMILILYGIVITILGYLTKKNIIDVLGVMILMPILHETLFLINLKKIKGLTIGYLR